MKVTIFYRPESEHAREVEEFIHEFKRRYPDANPLVLNVDSVEGSEKARIYDIMQYPSVIAASDDGSELQRWDKGIMPLMSEVAYYAN
jgi:hypothetical protein